MDVSDARDVTVDMTLTAPGCPVAEHMPRWVEDAVRSVDGVGDVVVNMVFEPPWDPSRMSDEGAWRSICFKFWKKMTQKYEIPKAISLTDRAAERIKHIMSRAETPKIGVRLGVKNGGCAGMEYTMDYADAREPLDEVVEDKGVLILIEPKAVLFLLGTEMDYEEGVMSSGFIFNNPNQTDACGCGESVTIVPANAR